MAEVKEFELTKGGTYRLKADYSPFGDFSGRYVREADYLALQSQRDELLKALISIKRELSSPNSYGPTQVSKVWHIACDTIAAIRRVEEV